MNRSKHTGLISLGVTDEPVLFKFSQLRSKEPSLSVSDTALQASSQIASPSSSSSSSLSSDGPLPWSNQLEVNMSFFPNVSNVSVGAVVDFALSYDRGFAEALDIAPLVNYQPLMKLTPEGFVKLVTEDDGKGYFCEAIKAPKSKESHHIEFKRLHNYKFTDEHAFLGRAVFRQQSMLGYVDKYINAFINSEGGRCLICLSLAFYCVLICLFTGTLVMGVEDSGGVIGIALSDSECDKYLQLVGQLLAKFEPPVPSSAYEVDIIPVYRACLFGGVPIFETNGIERRQRYVVAVRVRGGSGDHMFMTSGMIDNTRRCWKRTQTSVLEMTDADLASRMQMSN